MKKRDYKLAYVTMVRCCPRISRFSYSYASHYPAHCFSPWRQGQDYEFPDIFPKKDIEGAEEKPAASTAAQARPLEIEGVERIPEKGENERRTPPQT